MPSRDERNVKKMKAQMLLGPSALELNDIPVPDCGEDEVLIKIKRACICNGSDPALLAGAHLDKYPVVFGHEACGEIVERGRNVERFKIGDKVSWWFTMGAFAEYVCVNPMKVAMAILPDSISYDEGSLFELVAAASRAVESAEIKTGSKVLIIGLGPSGLIMSQLAKNLGASEVVGWDLFEMRRRTGLKFGCRKVLDNGLDDVTQKTLDEVSEVNVVIDAFPDDILPNMPTLDYAIKVLKCYGKIVSYGHPRNRRILDIYEFQKKCIQMSGPENRIDRIKQLIERGVDFVMQGKLNLKSLISGRVSLEKVQEGIDLVVRYPDKYIKILVDINTEVE